MTEARRAEVEPLLRSLRPAEGVDPRVTAESAVDLRVSMVLAVVGGRTVESVAQEWDVESSMLHRWVRDFLVAGTAAVTNRPDPDEARSRDRFLAAFAHELRTPVAVARGWSMMLAEGDVPEEQVEETFDRLTDALTRLSTHIAEVELSASVSLGRVRVNPELLDLTEMCRQLPGSPELSKGADVRVHADPSLLRRIMEDLWETAKREPAPEQVSIEVVGSATWVDIRFVRDGSPISPIVLQALFDPFGRNDDNTGVTMGLYLARALSVAHGGLLGAEGDGPRTVLYTRLPRDTSVEPEVTRPRDDRSQGGNP